jgi:hypothetical protein
MSMLALTAILAVCAAAPSQANAAGGGAWRTASVGISTGQTLRLNLLNLGEDRGIIINYRVLDADGAVVAAGERPVEVGPGKLVSIDLERDTIPRSGNRLQLRAEGTAIGDLKNLQVTLEVFNNADGKTTVFLPFIEQ